MSDQITDKQERFCQEYVIDLNGTQAAIRAGYSQDTAAEQASRLLTNVNVQNYIKRLQDEISSKLGVTAERVIAELAKIGFSDIKTFLGSSNSITDLSDTEADTSMVSSVKTTYTKEGSSTEIKLHSKIAALESLSKHLGIYEKDNKQKAIDAIRIIRE